jgi:hypothetical protein
VVGIVSKLVVFKVLFVFLTNDFVLLCMYYYLVWL